MGEDAGQWPTPATATPAGSVTTVPCGTCGAPVDPLRAARVACFGDRFRYFCSAECREHYAPDSRLTPVPLPERRSLGALRSDHVVAAREPSLDIDTRRHQAVALDHIEADGLEQLSPRAVPEATPLPLGVARDDRASVASPVRTASTTSEIGSLLLGISTLGGGLGVVLALAGATAVATHARLLLVAVGVGALVGESGLGAREPTEAHPAALLAGPVLALVAAVATVFLEPAAAGRTITYAGVIVVCVAGSVWLVQRARREVDDERAAVRSALEVMANRVAGDEVVPTPAGDLRPGEEIVAGPGEIVPADSTITAGSVEIRPWPGARCVQRRGEGESLVAGGQIVEGRIRAIVGWTGTDRAWLRLTNDPRRRADLVAPLARWGRLATERGAPVVAGLAGLIAFASNYDLFTIAMVVAATQSALASPGLAQVGALHVARAILEALRRGIVYRTADALDRAGRASATVFCARGTLLLGEPEVANIEPFGSLDAPGVLALVAGAEAGASHPAAAAVVRAARTRGVRPDGVRSPTHEAGLGVTAVASSGEPLVVGSRALMLRERISVARAEAKITELEAMGRSVLLVAQGGRLVGVVGLQDGLRPGARAAVQHLLDVGVEPILLSGDARETCEALGRVLDIDHVRPEVLPGERAEEVRRLAEGGAIVAVVGRSPSDEAALSAADVSIALDSAGSSAAEWSVQLASDDVRDTALAVRLAHQCRHEARLGLLLAGGPAVIASVLVAFSLAAPAVAPIGGFVGTLAALWRLRTSDA